MLKLWIRFGQNQIILCPQACCVSVCWQIQSSNFCATMWHEVWKFSFRCVWKKVPSCARLCGRNEEVTYPPQQRAMGRGPLQADSESRSRRWEITVWSKTMSLGSRVSARIARCVRRHAEPQSHHSDPVFHWTQGSGPTGLSADIQLLICQSWPVRSEMTLPSQ